MSSEAQDITSSSTPVSMSLGNGSGGGINKLQRNAHRSPEEEEERNSGAAMKLGNAEYTTAPQLPPPTSTNNVGELVTKAKKAAASLWMILHAQNCRLPNCPHRGCTDTKPLLLHVKICIAGPNFPCPTNYKGCNEARKLMAHYRKCKDVRSRQQQATGLVGRQLLRPADQGSCLVCSLMARYAKSMMERTAAISHDNNNNLNSLLKIGPSTAAATTTTSSTTTITSSIMDRKVITDENGLVNFATHHPFHPKRTPSMTLMPPPPPRRLSHILLPNGSKIMNDRNNSGVTIPMLWPSSSLVSSFGSIVEDDGLLVVPCPSTTNNNNNLRQRAVSCDERQSVELDGVLPPTTSTSRSGRCHTDVRGNEEYDATVPSSSSSSSSRGHKYNFVNNSRPRSASCSNLSMGCTNTGILRSLSSHHECGTIAEDST